jgi:anti-anti-sigma factor
MDLALRRTLIGKRHVLIVSGDVDLPTVPRFNEHLLKLVADAPGDTVVIDIDGADVVDDSALGLILGAAGRARSLGGDVVVVATGERVRQRLSENGFDRAVTVSSSISDAS